ncbi:hypothetical protein [Paenibacillus sp.]|uniref:hypothetical protein n=1 Tax=Paenibacillus sp. TaxID=58172 RepID=UPI002D4B77EE|nr:hypothetical protein [Paenibacillus sp.]HZG83680.1 hypothetical protein [Paenibacillus sp.]
MRSKGIAVILVLVWLLGCQQPPESPEPVDKSQEYALWSGRIDHYAEVLTRAKSYLEEDRVDEAAVLLKGFTISHNESKLYDRIREEVFFYLADYYGEEQASLLKRIEGNLHETVNRLPSFLEAAESERMAALETLLGDFLIGVPSYGRLGQPASNHDLNLSNIFVYPSHMNESHTTEEIEQLIRDKFEQSETIVSFLTLDQ